MEDTFGNEAGNLRTQLKKHNGENLNKCNQCDYASSQAHHLKRHLKAHSGEKSYKCKQCDYASSDQGNLRKHVKTHMREKSNKCNMCDYAFSYASTLKRHLKTHDGENSQQMHQEKSYISSNANTLKIHWKALEENKLTKASGRKIQFHNLLPFFVEKCGTAFEDGKAFNNPMNQKTSCRVLPKVLKLTLIRFCCMLLI